MRAKASMVEGAFDSTLTRRRRTIVTCDAPSTALRAVPLPRYRGAGGRIASLFERVDQRDSRAKTRRENELRCAVRATNSALRFH
jgi:hypothetical protein